MFISAGDLTFMFICAIIIAFITTLLWIANYRLLNQNRFLKARFRAHRKHCADHHYMYSERERAACQKPW